MGTEDLEVSGVSRVSVGVATIHLSGSASLAHRGRVVIREPRPRSLPSPTTRLHHHLSTHVSRAGSPRICDLVTRQAEEKEKKSKKRIEKGAPPFLSPSYSPNSCCLVHHSLIACRFKHQALPAVLLITCDGRSRKTTPVLCFM